MGTHAGTFFFDARPAAHLCDVLRLGLQPFAPDGPHFDPLAMVVDATGHIIVGGTTVLLEPDHRTQRAVLYRLDP